MRTELKNKIDLLIVDLQEYRDGNNNITDFHIIASMLDVKDDICDGVTGSVEEYLVDVGLRKN
jgi:hypothetical protein